MVIGLYFFGSMGSPLFLNIGIMTPFVQDFGIRPVSKTQLNSFVCKGKIKSLEYFIYSFKILSIWLQARFTARGGVVHILDRFLLYTTIRRTTHATSGTVCVRTRTRVSFLYMLDSSTLHNFAPMKKGILHNTILAG